MRCQHLSAILLLLLAGCQTGGAPAMGTFSATPGLPANATFNGNLVPPPATGSYQPPPSAYAANGTGAAGNSLFPNGFNVNGWLPSGWTTNGFNTPASAPPNAVTAMNGQNPFGQRYQPLSLNTTGSMPAATGFTPTSNVPPTAYGQGSAPGFQPSQPSQSNWTANAASYGAPPSFNQVNTGGFNPQGSQPTYAGNNPLLSWANRLHNYVFNAAAPEPGQWQTWSASGSNNAPSMTNNTGFSTNSNSALPANWRPEPRSLRTPNDNYAPEPPVRIPDAALAGAVNAARQLPNYPPPTYPARPNAATQPTTSAALPPRNNATTPAGNPPRFDSAWPELTSFPQR